LSEEESEIVEDPILTGKIIYRFPFGSFDEGFQSNAYIYANLPNGSQSTVFKIGDDFLQQEF
jgi:hypothetical protein